MRLRALRIERMPGIRDRTVEGFGDAVTVVTGPNESGKTSLVRAVRALLWGQETAGTRPWDLSATVEVAGEHVLVEREGGRSRWSTASGEAIEAPALLPDARYAGCYTIELDQLARADDPTGVELGRQLRAQLNGGVDVDAAHAHLVEAVPTGRAEKGAWLNARSAYGEAQRRQAALSATRDRMSRIEDELEQVAALGRRLETLQRVVQWRVARSRVEIAEQSIAALPVPAEALAAVEDQDRASWEQLLRHGEVTARSEREAEARVRATLDAIEQSPLQDPVPQSQLEELASRIAQLEQSHAAYERLELELQRAAGRSDAANEQLGGHAAPEETKPRDVERVRRLVVELGQLEAARASVEHRLPADGAAPGGAQRGSRGAAAARAALPAVVVTVVLALVASVWLAAAVHVAGAGLALVSLACGAIAVGRLRDRGNDAVSPGEEERVERRAALRELERIAERRSALEAELAAAAGSAGAALAAEPGALADWLHRLAQAREAAAQLAGARREVEAARAARQAVVDQVTATLGEAPGGAGWDLPAARAAREELCRASDALRVARECLPELRQRLQGAIEDGAAARAHRARWLEARGIDPSLEDDDATGRLTHLWAQVRSFRPLMAELVAARAARDELAARLQGIDQRETADLTLEELQDQLDAARRAHGRQLELTSELERARSDVERAVHGHELTDALRAREEAQAQLEARRDEALQAQAAAFLVQHAASAYARDHAPPLVESANAMLAAATGDRYAIAIIDGELAARRLGTERPTTLALGELSSGTRAQLLVAARLAFARHAERGERLPIFVDEALSTSDPERFAAVVRALDAIARDDERQVVYLTSDPDDASSFELVLTEHGSGVSHVELGGGLVGTGVARPATSRQLAVSAPPQVAAPVPGEASESWAQRIGVPTLRPHADIGDVHVWHVHEPDLATVERMLRSRVLTVGQARSLDDRGLLPSLLGEQTAELVRVRQDAFEAFVEAWRVGRERRLERPDDLRRVLAHAGVNASRWQEPLWDWLVQHGRSGAALLDALRQAGSRRDAELKGFRLTEELAASLVELGFAPTGEPLDDATIIATVHARVAALGRAGLDVAGWVHAWIQRAGSGEPRGARTEAVA